MANSFQARLVQSSGNNLDHTPGSAVAAGEVVVQGALVGVAANAIAANELGAIQTEGVFDLAKDDGASVSFAVGDIVDWDDTNNLAIATGGSGTRCGRCVKAAANGDATVRVKLNAV